MTAPFALRHADAAWRAVPEAVTSFVKLAGVPALVARRSLPADGYAAAYLHLDRGVLYVRGAGDGVDWDEVGKEAGFRTVADLSDAPPPGLRDGDEPWLLVKRGDPVTQAAAGAVNLVPTPLNELVGGPTPLAAILSGGALGAVAGYGTGALIERVLGRDVVERNRLRKILAAAGAAAGAAPGAWWGAASAREHPDRSTWASFTSPWPHGSEAVKEAFQAAGFDASDVPAIPRNRFGQAVWADEQTPLPIRAATVGLVDAAAQAGGSPWVSPVDVARVAVGMGSGYASGMIVGKVLGAMAGLSQPAQQSLRRAGTWAGVLTGVVPMAFGR